MLQDFAQKEKKMGRESHSYKCECGNFIEIDTYHHAGGVNDKDKVILKCNQCGKTRETIVKNIESAAISGASIIR